MSPLIIKRDSQKSDHKRTANYISKIGKLCYNCHDKGLSGNPDTNSDILTDRKKEVAKVIVAGFRNKMIADAAHISLDTIKTHIRHLFQKMDVQAQLQAVIRTKDRGILP
jgi:ATP/maltotriose-dependent transcriptional regulator MalT